ncbi:Elongator subunit [Saccharomycopsis crataegensis]|uniref:Elongator subunit n=1 Tax=Saccharomycopsis crataegensis TaxID=43959 RepID=A0AAV5QT55_9ASCO|nr:Elongator subunit [Saccharomycopsis crataegensis]
MGTRQKQDLTIFNDNSVICPQLLDSKIFHPFTGLITSVEGTSPIWLINTLIEELLFGKCRLNSSVSSHHHNTSLSKKLDRQVTYISLSNNLSYYSYYFKKLTSIDLTTQQDRFQFINCFDDLFTKILKDGDISEESVVKNLFETHILKNIAPSNNRIIFIDGLEFLVSASNVKPITMVKFLHNLQKSCQGLFLISSVDEELIDFAENNDRLIEHRITQFYSYMIHKSNFVVNARPLSTGRADDISGNLRISKGMVGLDWLLKHPQPNNLQVLEKEYLFLVKKDFTVDLFYK